MRQEDFQSRLYHGVCCFILFMVAASASFNGFYEKWHFCEAGMSGQYDRAYFESMVDGTAWRPYVYRQMLPTIANWLDEKTPEPLKNWLYNRQGNGHTAYSISAIADSPTPKKKAYFFRYLVVYVTTFLFALLAVYAMHLVCKALEMPPTVAIIAPVVVILLIPYIMSVGGYDYDYSELALYALAVWILLKADWWWAIPVAALGAWNKESFLLVIPALYPMIRRRSSRFGALLGICVLCTVCAAVYLPERIQFAHNPGVTMEFRLHDQLQLLLNPRRLLFATEETYGIRMLRAFTVVPLSLLAWTVSRGWKWLPPFIRSHGKIAAAINIPLYIFFCGPGETRDLSLLYIVFLATVAVNLNEWIGGSERATALQPRNRNQEAVTLT